MAKRYVSETLSGRDGASEDPNFTAMIEEFRATRAFLREVLVFTDASALHIQRVMDVQTNLELVLSAAPASVESQMGWGGVDMGAAGARAAAKAERELNSLMFDVSGRIAAIATAQRAWLLSQPPLQTALCNFLDVIAPDADETLARYSRARVKFDAFRSEVIAGTPHLILPSPTHISIQH